jgi:hypothetical protein
LKDKINELATNSKNKNTETYMEQQMQSRRVANLELTLKDERGDLLQDSNNISGRWKNYFSQLLNVHRASDVRQI